MNDPLFDLQVSGFVPGLLRLIKMTFEMLVQYYDDAGAERVMILLSYFLAFFWLLYLFRS